MKKENGLTVKHLKSLERLWQTAAAASEVFDPSSIENLPPVARRYLTHALAPGARLSTCARLTMSGAIRLEPGWCDFEAEQVLHWDRGFVWAARTKMKGLPVIGFDRLIDGAGAMRWKLLGLFPVMAAEGAEISRAAAGRLHAEAIWLPAVLLTPDVSWADKSRNHTVATFEAHGERSQLHVEVDDRGRLRNCHLARWGDFGGGDFRYHPFGGFADRERTFQGITIPTHHRVGWCFGTPKFESEGEFFRCTLKHVQYA